ncbi:MAG: hypothetical protein HYR66_18085 [Sphingobacteriales bacterium]|nr:hypothetical protein [Sphingobacteriales bacterium]MBI3717448.1 hypothetical protein [Sphingobacteriales bacterium]
MKTWKKIILIVVVAVAAAGGYKGYRMYTDGPENYSDQKAITVNAVSLLDDYNKSEADANKKYLDKVVAVKGEVKDVTTNQEGQMVVTLKTSDPMNSINCTMDQKDAAITQGTNVTLKGLCTGYMMDVYITRCTVVK